MNSATAHPPLLHTCPVCAYTLAQPFFDGGEHPLATLGWPASAEEAVHMPRLPLSFVQCPSCTHVWNAAFSYDAVPYKSNPNRMFNSGNIWRGHLADTRNRLLARLPDSPTVVEIGCGEGHFLRGLSESLGGRGRFIGFDPNASPESGQGVEFFARLFDPLVHMTSYQPDAVVIRHVLEHLTEPAQIIEQLAWGATQTRKTCYLFAEVPCIDRVFSTERLADFFYEHVSHFTTESFRTLLRRGGEQIELAHGYDGEVVFACVELGLPAARLKLAASATAFAAHSVQNRAQIAARLDALASSGMRIAIWGGTGKSAAFIHHYGADAQRFPLVVDSDRSKAGSFVPGTGQEIQFRDILKKERVDVVIIPTQWRARDIVAEMQREDIQARQILIEHEGDLVDYALGQHPY